MKTPSRKLKISPVHQAELARIQSSIPKEWQGNAIVEKEGFATVKEVMRKILKDKKAPKSAKEKAKLLLDSKMLDGKVQESEPVAAELIDAYVAKEILKSVALKKLPKPARAPRFETAFKRYKIAKDAYDKKYPEKA